MNVTEQARAAYAPAQVHISTPRAIEAQLLSEVTSRLALAGQPFPRLAAALHDNRRIWVTLATGVADAANVLPEILRARIFYLAEFTDRHTESVLRGEAEVAPLIDINTAVMRGLNGQATTT